MSQTAVLGSFSCWLCNPQPAPPFNVFRGKHQEALSLCFTPPYPFKHPSSVLIYVCQYLLPQKPPYSMSQTIMTNVSNYFNTSSSGCQSLALLSYNHHWKIIFMQFPSVFCLSALNHSRRKGKIIVDIRKTNGLLKRNPATSVHASVFFVKCRPKCFIHTEVFDKWVD